MALTGKYKILLTVLLLLILGVLFYTFFIQIRQIGPGHVGVKSSIESSDDSSIETVKGYVVLMPLLTDLVVYPTTIQTVVYDQIKIATNDGIEFNIKPRISYQLDEKRAGLFYKACHHSFSDANNAYIKELTRTAFELAAGTYSSDSLVNNKQGFEQYANSVIVQKMNEIGLKLINSNAELQVPQKLQDVIDLRNHAIQNAIVAEARKKQAEAEADEQYAIANGQRRKDSLHNSSLTPLSIQKMFIDKWDGRLSTDADTPRALKEITEIK